MNIKFKKSHISIFVFFIITFIAILFFWGYHCESVNQFNSIEHTVKGTALDAFAPQNNSADSENAEDIALLLYPRNGQSDSWVKEYNSPDFAHHDLIGRIYEMSILNQSPYDISSWTVTQRIHQDCYINNAWCGDVEFHIFDENGNEQIQKINFNNYDLNDISVKYEVRGTDLLIPLHEGDYFIYYPSSEVNETPILSVNSDNSGIVSCGFIYYYWDNGVELGDSTINYYFNKSYKQGSSFSVFTSLLGIWITAFAITAILLSSSSKLEKQEVFIEEALTVFTHFIDAKDPYTNGHSNRVADYSRKIAKSMGMSEADCKNVYYIALLHDVGKCYIKDEILKKPERLSKDEFEEIKKHTVLGAKMLKELNSLPDIYNGALYHHERYDGKGYPTGKAGSDIPLIGRIICVADSFDAMNSDRCYRSRLNSNEIIKEIENNSGTQFDPEIASVFLKLLKNGTISFDE